MCIIIHKPAGATLALSSVLRGYQRNDDGWGLIARTPAGLVVQRDFGPDADASLLDAFDSLRAHALTIHCRIGTSGNASFIINTHPFNVVGDLWMVHNGVINIDRSADSGIAIPATLPRRWARPVLNRTRRCATPRLSQGPHRLRQDVQTHFR